MDLVRLTGMRWPIESIFEEGKGEAGFDYYETRSWLGWHHHMLLSFLAHHFLVRLRLQLEERAPALTVYQVRLLLLGVLPKPVFDAAAALQLVQYYQKRNRQIAGYRRGLVASFDETSAVGNDLFFCCGCRSEPALLAPGHALSCLGMIGAHRGRACISMCHMQPQEAAKDFREVGGTIRERCSEASGTVRKVA